MSMMRENPMNGAITQEREFRLLTLMVRLFPCLPLSSRRWLVDRLAADLRASEGAATRSGLTPHA